MPGLGLGSALWAAVLPVQKVNLLPNPSYELGDYNTAAVSGGVQVLGTSSAFQQFGAWGLLCVPNTNGTSGASVGTWQSGNGTAYTASSYVRGAAAQPYTMCVQDQSSLAIIGSVDFTGGGTWQRVSMSYTETGDTTRKLTIRKTSGAGVGSYWIDGSQVEVGSLTSYIDGDQTGCAWFGQWHNSQSQRSGSYRGGGSVVALADLGFQVNDMLGAGVPPIEVSTQSYAVVDGANFQRQRAAQRKLTLTAKPLAGTSLADFHVTRRTVWDALKPDAVTPQQPVRFVYVGAQGTQQLDAYYDSGLELGNMDGPIAESMGVSFIATDPYWHAPTQTGTVLAPRLNLGSAKYIANRDPLGRWGTMGPSGSALDGVVGAIIAASSGVVYVGGAFGSAGGTRVRFIAQWNPRTGQWGSLPGGTLSSSVSALLEYPNGSIYVGGALASANGTTANGIAVWSPAGSWGTTNGGGGNSGCSFLGITRGQNGTIYTVATHTTIAGTAGTFAAQYSPITDRWGTMRGFNNAGGAAGAGPNVNATGIDGKIFYGGAFNAINGTTAGSICYWDPKTANWGTMAPGIANQAVSGILAFAVSPNGKLWIGGDFGTAGGGSVSDLTSWNGVAYTGYGSGLNSAPQSLFAGSSGQVYISAAVTVANGVIVPQGGVVFNGASFAPIDAVIPVPGPMTQASDGTLYVSMSPVGSLYCASVAQIVNGGRAQVYPNLRLRNLSTGTARAFQLLNTTTGNGIYFTLSMAPGEIATLDLTPGERSFQSNYQGNVFGQILPGSNIATWSLLPGTNYVSFFSDNDSLEAAFFYTPRGWAADSGTVY